MKRGERRFREALRGLKPPKLSWWSRVKLPRLPLTPGQWFRLALLVAAILATLLGVEMDWLQRILELLVK